MDQCWTNAGGFWLRMEEEVLDKHKVEKERPLEVVVTLWNGGEEEER